MADPATIVGLASGMIALVTFGCKVVSVAKTVYHGTGTLPELRELDLIVANVQGLTSKIRAAARSGGAKISEDDHQLVLMADECERLAGELREILEGLKMPDNPRLLQSTLIALRAITKKGELDNLRDRLDKLDMRLRVNIGHALQR